MAGIIYDGQYRGYKVKTADGRRVALGRSPKFDEVPEHIVELARPHLGEAAPKPKPVKVDDSETVDGFIRVYLTRKQKTVRPDTMPNLVTVLRQFQAFCKRKAISRLDAVEVRHINQWVDEIGEKLMVTSVVTKLTVISGLYTMAVKEGRVKDHPVKYPLECAREAVGAYRSNKTTADIKYLTPEQQARYWAAFDRGVASGKTPEWLRDLALLMAFSGLRIKAATYLTFADLDRDFANIPAPLDKGCRGYSAFLFGRAREVVERRRAALGSGRVFPVVNHRRVWHRLRTFLEQNGLADMIALGHYCHVLRHTHAVSLVGQGVPLQVIQSQLGHADITTTQVYAKVSRDTHRAALADVKI